MIYHKHRIFSKYTTIRKTTYITYMCRSRNSMRKNTIPFYTNYGHNIRYHRFISLMAAMREQ